MLNYSRRPDVNYSSKQDSLDPKLYPLYDVTSSGLTQAETWYFIPPNTNRLLETDPIGGKGGNNWGRLTLDFQNEPSDPILKLEVLNSAGEVKIKKHVSLSELSFENKSLGIGK